MEFASHGLIAIAEKAYANLLSVVPGCLCPLARQHTCYLNMAGAEDLRRSAHGLLSIEHIYFIALLLHIC
jgi:hypothetical protein